MGTSLKFGADCLVELDLAGDSLVATNTEEHPETLADVSAAVRQAFDAPIDFPSLREMVLPDDTVAIAIEPALACAKQLVAGTIRALMEAAVPPELISIVRAADDRAISDNKLLSDLDDGVADRIQVFRHDAKDRESLSFLGASKDDHAIYVNRVLCDASVVIPITSQRSLNEVDCLGVHNSWFPVFADAETQDRFAKTLSALSARKNEKRRAECEEAAWMLGVQMLVQVIPAGNDAALHVLAGLPESVWKKSGQLAKDAWDVRLSRRASLVVAAISGGPDQQTWDNVVRTIDTALDAVEIDGAIAICSQLRSKPGPALQKLAGAEDYESAERAIRRKPSTDALAASRLNRALQHARVYLLSELDEHEVEDLGVAWVADSGEIAKLSSRFQSCLVLRDAQHVSISIDE